MSENVDCPDCQLQLLQQQQHQSQNPPLSSNNSIPSSSSTTQQTATPDTASLGHRSSMGQASEVGYPHMGKSTHYTQVESSNHHYQLSTIHNIRTPSASGLNMYHYGGDYGSGSSMSNSSSMHQTTTSLQGLSPSDPSNPSSSIPMAMTHTDLNYGNGSIESCDYNGYCSTCAVLDLPSNEKYYHRSTNPRTHVFPPIFYSQGPSSVIPGFSSISDWTNGEYANHYGYPVQFSQPTASTVPVGPSSSELAYGSVSHPMSHTPTGTNNHLMPPSFDVFTSHNTSSSMLQHSYQNQRHGHGQVSSSTSSSSSMLFSSGTTTIAHPPVVAHNATSSSTSSSHNNNVPSLHITDNPNNNKMQESHNSSNETKQLSSPKPTSSSACFVASSLTPTKPNISNSNNSSHQHHAEILDSSDAESSGDSDCDSSLASEDRELISVVEEDDDDDDDDETESTRVRPGGKCFICHNLIEITDCSSPQLAKILENIEDDIDLDMTGDIEIGGMEDESNQQQLHKKRHASGPYSGMLSSFRLMTLLGLSSKSAFGPESGDNDVAILCFQCGKLASMADSLERQLSAAIQTLHHQLRTTAANLDNSTEECTPPHHQSLNGLGKSTQVEECVSPIELFQIHSSLHKEVQTELIQHISCGTQICPSSAITTEKVMHAETQCCSNDFAILSFVDQNSYNCLPTSSTNEEDSSLEDSQDSSEQDDPNFDSSISCIHSSTPHNTAEESSDNLIKTIEPSQILYPNFLAGENNVEEMVPQPQNSSSENSNNSTSLNSSQSKLDESQPLNNIALNNTLSKLDSGREQYLSENNQEMNRVQNLFSCQSCHRIFSTKSNLRAHIKICKARLLLDQEEVEKIKDMKCMECGVGFRSVLRQRQHMEQGCKPLNFRCDMCHRRFAKLSELKSHLYVHRGEKPFSCDKCGASFATKGNQIAHSKTHSEDKKFQCNQCQKGFNRKFALTVHLNCHNGKSNPDSFKPLFV